MTLISTDPVVSMHRRMRALDEEIRGALARDDSAETRRLMLESDCLLWDFARTEATTLEGAAAKMDEAAEIIEAQESDAAYYVSDQLHRIAKRARRGKRELDDILGLRLLTTWSQRLVPDSENTPDLLRTALARMATPVVVR